MTKKVAVEHPALLIFFPPFPSTKYSPKIFFLLFCFLFILPKYPIKHTSSLYYVPCKARKFHNNEYIRCGFTRKTIISFWECCNFIFFFLLDVRLDTAYFTKNWKLKIIKIYIFQLLFINEIIVHLPVCT